MYYDVPAQRFLYVKNGGWVRAERLPARYSGYNLRNGKVIYLTDYKRSTPYAFHKQHKVKYVGKKYYPKNYLKGFLYVVLFGGVIAVGGCSIMSYFLR